MDRRWERGDKRNKVGSGRVGGVGRQSTPSPRFQAELSRHPCTATSDLTLVVRVVQLARQADHHLPGAWALGGYARRLAVASVRYAAEDAVYCCATGGATWEEVWGRYGGMRHTRHTSRFTPRARGWVTTMGVAQWIGVMSNVPWTAAPLGVRPISVGNVWGGTCEVMSVAQWKETCCCSPPR